MQALRAAVVRTVLGVVELPVAANERHPMTLTRDELYAHIDGLHLDDLDIAITANGRGGFSVTEVRGGSYVSDIGSSYEVPDTADEHGRVAFTAGPWTAHQYHASYTAPRRDNYEAEIDDLAAGDVSKVVLGYGAVVDADDDSGTWVFGIRTED